MISLTIMREVPSQNESRVHWSVLRKERKAMGQAVMGAKLQAHVTGQPPAKAKVHICAYRKRRITDVANLIGGCKGLVDSLTEHGLIADDNDKVATFTYQQELASAHDSKRPCTVVTIESI